MEYVHALLLLAESGEELNEGNITAVLEAAGIAVEQSRVKALVAAMEGVSLDELDETALASTARRTAAPESADASGTTADPAGEPPGRDGGSATGESGMQAEPVAGNGENGTATTDDETGAGTPDSTG